MRWTSYWHPRDGELNEFGKRVKAFIERLNELGATAEPGTKETTWGTATFTFPNKLDSRDFNLFIRLPKKRGAPLRMEIGNYPHTKGFPEPKKGFDAKLTIERIREHFKVLDRASEIAHSKASKRHSLSERTAALSNDYGDIKCVDFRSSRPGGRYEWHDCEPYMVIDNITPEEASQISEILRKTRK